MILRHTIRARLLAGLAAMLLPLLLLAGGSYHYLTRLLGQVDEILEESTDELLPVARLQNLISRSAMPANDYLLAGDPAERSNFRHLEIELGTAFEQALAGVFGTAELWILNEAQQAWQQGRAMSLEILALDDPLGAPDGDALMERMDAQIDRAADLIDELLRTVVRESREHAQQAHGALREFVALVIAVLVIGLVAAALVSFLISRTILQPLGSLVAGSDRFGPGRFSRRIESMTGNDLAGLADAFNQMADKVEALTGRDELTGLLNRRIFHLRLTERFLRSSREHQQLALLKIDFAPLQGPTDGGDPVIGDAALSELARRVGAALREIDTVCRYGGSELVAILPATDPVAARAVAERLQELVGAVPLALAEVGAVAVAVNIGVAVYPLDATDEEGLIAAADAALRHAKEGGRNRVMLATDAT